MRVAFLVGAFPSLSETFILNQITGLIDRGHAVEVYGWPSADACVHDDVVAYGLMDQAHLAPPIPDSFVRRLTKGLGLLPELARTDPRTLHTLNLAKYGRLAASLRLLYASAPHAGRAVTYDVAHCHFGQNGLIALVLREHGLLDAEHVLTTFHGRDVYVDVPAYAERTRRILFERGDAFTVNSAYTAENVLRLGGRKRDLWTLPVGLDVEAFSFRSRRRSANEPVRILTVGRLVEKKGVEYAVRALARLAPDVDFEYRVVGGGPLRASLEALADEKGIRERVRFFGAQPQDAVREQYAWAHLFTLPSVTASDGDREGQGLVLQEAQACGLPVVATDHNGFPNGVRDGASAVLVPERDVDALADAMRTLIQNDDAWEEMGRAGRTFVEREYDIDVLNDRLVEIYRSL